MLKLHGRKVSALQLHRGMIGKKKVKIQILDAMFLLRFCASAGAAHPSVKAHAYESYIPVDV